MPICATRILTDEEIHEKVMKALAIEKKRELKRLGREFEERSRVGVVDNVCSDNGMPVAAMEAIVMLNKTSATNSLSKAEWDSIDAAMPAEEAKTHKNLSAWITDRAKASGITADDDEEEDDDPEMDALLQDGSLATGEEGGDDGDEEPEKKDEKKDDKEEEFVPVEKAKNWSSINTVAKESKLSFRGSFTPISFTNWLWYRCVRPKLEDTKSKLPELEDEELFGQYHVDDVDDVLLEFMPPAALKKSDDKKDKKDKKDDKKDKKDDGKKDKKDDGKKSKDDGKKDDGKKADKKKKKDIVQLNAKEKLQAQNLIRHMVYGESEKKRTTVEGWVNLLEEKEMPTKCPWEFQIAHVMRSCMAMEYASKKKKDDSVDKFQYYEMAQALADAISMLKRQYKVEFPDQDVEAVLLPLRDALDLQRRFREGSVPGINFDILWYLQNGASLLAGSSFTKKHRTTIFQPFEIQQKMVDAILQKGPQLVFGIAPPGTGKTAIVSHLAALFPAHHLVFCCAALPVVLGVGRVLKSRGVPFAFAKGRRITPSYSCGKNLGTHVDLPASEGSKGMSAVASLGYTVMKMNLERKQKRLAEKKKKRNLHDLKRFPRMFLMCDTASCAWLLRQLDPHRTILVVDEPPMGSDSYPETPESNPLACAMIQAMMTPAYKTIWMSATLPRVEALPTLVNCFLSRFQLSESDRDKHVRECFSIQLDRGALLCGPSGSVAFPHQRCTTAEELERLCKRLPTDPLVLKAYTERALASLVQRWQTLDSQGKVPPSFKKRMPDLGAKFADLSNLNHTSIREYAMELLQAVAAEGDDDFTLAFCQKDEAEKNVFPAFSLEEMLFSNAYAFPGLTLVADDDPKGQMELMSKRLQAHMPKASDIEEDLKSQEVSAAKAAKFADDDEKARMEEHQAKLKFSPELVIQSEQFLKRWCPNYKAEAGGARITRLLPTVQEFKKIKELPVTEQWQMLALSGAGSFDPLLDADVHDPVYTQWVHESMTMNKLACVTAGKEFTWGANVPASTVVVTKSFAETTSVAGMLQYVGRAARRGLTTHGQAIFERDEDLERIFANPDGLSTEALTMERYAKWWLSRGSEW